MDAHRFDSLTRHLAQGQTRRDLVRGLVASFVASVLPSSSRQAAAACKKVGKKCDQNGDCCDHATCKSKKCRCKDGFKNCDGKCFDLDTDEKHCGSCTNDCPSDDRCCDGGCVNLDEDLSNCGACGRACKPGEVCCEGQCADFDRSEAHCGECGIACPADQECVLGTCLTLPDNCPRGGDSCAASGTISCGNDLSTCVCLQTTEGFTVCGESLPSGDQCSGCETSADCPQGPLPVLCVRNECCPDGPSGRNACVTICGPEPPGQIP